MTSTVIVIAIDGPSASGKGTVAQGVARSLGFHFLDSGALYRLVALAVLRAGLGWDDEQEICRLTGALDVLFLDGKIFMAGEDVSEEIRSERCGDGASRVGAIPGVRAALLGLQRGYRRAPGLVADGRDMGTVVFPDAALKIYLTASVEARAARRHKQLIQKGIAAKLPALLEDIQSRDLRDMSRTEAPLKPSPEARVLDTTMLSADEAIDRVLLWFHALAVPKAE